MMWLFQSWPMDVAQNQLDKEFRPHGGGRGGFWVKRLFERYGVVWALVHAGSAVEAFLLIYDGDIVARDSFLRADVHTCTACDAFILVDFSWHLGTSLVTLFWGFVPPI